MTSRTQRTKNVFIQNRFIMVARLIFISIFAVGILSIPVNADTKIAGKVCSGCHEDQVAALKGTVHEVENCFKCHGDAAKHIKDVGEKGTIFAFGSDDTPIKKAKKCMTCHKDSQAKFLAGPHGKAAMDCTTCHGICLSKRQTILRLNPSKNCFSCHEDVFAKFQLNEKHRLKEGMMECTTCHNPHEPGARNRLAGFKQESCFKCHTDKQGPFVYEHDASRIEGCTSCHDVHGSPNRHLLLNQNTGELCFSCHATAASWHVRFTPETNCVTCHSTIHGSNLDHLFLK